ncbi:MAG: signal peptidase I [Oscillospiraceae bacterium]|nr:signal peptidase I [Oscillospiraceae bacterium]
MKKNKNDMFHLAALLILVAAQVIYLLIPSHMVVLFNRLWRPLIYLAIIAALYGLTGWDRRYVKNRKISLTLAGFGVLLFGSAILAAGVLFGFGENSMAAGSFGLAVEHIWVFAAVACMSEVLRVKIIKDAPKEYREITAIVLTLVYMFLQLDTLRSVDLSYAKVLDFLIVTILPVLTMNAVLSYIAVDGSLLAVLIIRAVYSLSTFFLPVLPAVSEAVWAVMRTALLVGTFAIYFFNMDEDKKIRRRQAKRHLKYQKKPLDVYIITAALVIIVVSFVAGAFSYYPVVVLTDSMEDTFGPGSVVVSEKISREEAFGAVKEGDILHFKRGNVEYTHRVIEFRYNADGERTYITQGDNSPNPDSQPVEPDQIIGITRAFVPYIGYPFVWIRTLFNG